MENLNIHQMQLLQKLAFRVNAKFSDIQIPDITSDHSNYHIKKLIELGLVQKVNSLYSLTNKGKDYIGRMDVETKVLEIQPKTSVIPICIKEIDSQKYYLTHKRKKHPYFDWIGFPSGKVKAGNLLQEEVLRELKEETGLIGFKPELKIVQHSLVHIGSDAGFFEDKIFYHFVINRFEGELLAKTVEGENQWMTKEELFSQPNVYESTLQYFDLIHAPHISFIEEVLRRESL